jgi:hypothetical protein
VLSLREGQDFYLDDAQVLVTRVEGLMHFQLMLASSGQSFVITDAESVEVMPDVFVSAGDRPQRGIARVAIDAPREIRITRGDRWREYREQEP